MVCFETATNCSQCQPSGINETYLYPQNFSCLKSCPVGTYSNLTDHVCYMCDPSCLNCSFNSSYCYKCDSSIGYIWFNFTCIQTCPALYFLDTNNNCSTCSPYCQECFNLANNCSICTLNGAFMAYLSGSTCLTTCPTGTYSSTNGGLVNLCIDCDLSCLACTASPSPCSSCAPHYYLYENSCSSSCPNGYFA